MTDQFKEWIRSTQSQRDALIVYSQTGKPPTEEGRAIDSLTAIKMTDEADRLLCEAEKFLSHERELAMWEAKKKHHELTSRERELIERSEVREAQMIVDSCKVTHRSCVNRYFNYRGKL